MLTENGFMIALREEIRSALPPQAFIRRDRGDALLITNAPAFDPEVKCPPGFLAVRQGALLRIYPDENRILDLEKSCLEPPDHFCRSLMRFRGMQAEQENLLLFVQGAKLLDGVMAKALYYAFSARTVCPGVLNVPGPQGNGGGFISAVLNAVKEERNLSDEDMLRGLFVAAGVGAICYTRTKPTGEEIGCAGECGCCCAMAAAAVVEMTGGTGEQIDAAASMAMQLAIGWPCDVIPGGSGAPCTARIMAVAVMSIVFAQWALIDEDPIIPFHEALDAAAALGENMHPDLLCTGRGGMCVTPSAKKCAAALQAARQKKN